MPLEKNNLFKDVQTQKRIHEHLTNQNDLISDEDISNVKTNVAPQEAGVGRADQAEEKIAKTEKTETPVNSSDTSIETPWNVLK
ncbi:MAG: hypothetical protein ABIQ31_01650 [Ferruginibacter sp.]